MILLIFIFVNKKMKVMHNIGVNDNNKNFIEKENLQNEKYNNNYSFGDLSLSDIGNKEKNYIPISKRTNYKIPAHKENYVSDVDKSSSLGSLKFEDFNNILFKKNKLTKEDLNKIPIPIFSCIYCSNEKILFKHFLNEIISNKYLLMASIYDIRELNRILSYKYLIDKDEKNNKLEDIIIKNTEYVKKYYMHDELKKLLNLRGEDKKSFEIYQKKYIMHIRSLLNNIKLKKIRNNLNSKPSIAKKLNQYYSFNYNNINNLNNISINNSIDGNGELNNNYKKNNQNNINQTISNLSASNFNSVSLINYIDNNYQKEKENRFKLDDIIEQIEKNSNAEYFDYEKSRNIKKEDIEWESVYYNIWDPVIELEIGKKITSITKQNVNKINNTSIKKQKRNNSFYKKIKENTLSIKKLSKRIPSKGKGNFIYNKSYQKINGLKNKSKEISPENNKNVKKKTINHLISYSSSKNNNKKNILINLNINSTKYTKDTPTKTKTKKYTFNQKYISHKNLNPISSYVSLNINKKINLFPKNLFNSSKKINKMRNNQIKGQIPLNSSTENKSTIFKKKAKSKINCRIAYNKSNTKENLNKNKINNGINFILKNTSISKKNKIKKIEIINTSPKCINKIKKNKLILNNKLARNNTYQNLENIKEKTFLVNISSTIYNSINEPQFGLSNKKLKIDSKKIFNSKLNKNNLKNNQNKNDKHNNIHIQNKIGINKTKFNIDIDNKKNIYNIKILTKKSIEIKSKNLNKKIIY